MGNQRKVQSFDAGTQAHDAGQARDTHTSDYFIDRASWLAGWDDAAYMATQDIGTLDDVTIDLPTTSPVGIHHVHDMARRFAMSSRNVYAEYLRTAATENGCVIVQMGRHVCIYSAGSTHRFSIALDGVCVNGRKVGDIVRND